MSKAERVTVKEPGADQQVAKELQETLERTVTEAYISVVKKAFPWMTDLTISRDDETLEWYAVFQRDSELLACPLAGTTFPQFADDFVSAIRRHMVAQVDHEPMKRLAAELEAYEADQGKSEETGDEDSAEIDL